MPLSRLCNESTARLETHAALKTPETLRGANEKLWLLNRRERNDQPPAAVELDVRVLGTLCVSLFPGHWSFLSVQRYGRFLLLSMIPKQRGRGNAVF